MNRILVTGSRHFTNRALMTLALKDAIRLHGPEITIVHGGALGADILADRVGAELGCMTVTYLADWLNHGRAAGPIRNTRMVNSGPFAACLAFYVDGVASKGTADCVAKAQAKGITVYPYRQEATQ